MVMENMQGEVKGAAFVQPTTRGSSCCLTLFKRVYREG